MRSFILGLAVIALAASLGTAQQPQAKPAAPAGDDPAQKQLDAVLMQWERQMQGVQSLWAQLNRTTVNKTFNSTDVFEGWAKYLKNPPGGKGPASRAVLELKKKGDPQAYEKFIFTDTFIYQFRPEEKRILAHEPPPPKPGQAVDDNVMSFVFGMKAEEAKRRYLMTLQKPEDQHYWYITVQPRFAEDKQEFKMARLVLLKSNYLPRQFWYVQPNDNQVTFDIPKIEPNSPAVAATDFVKPAVPPGWKLEMAPRTNPQAGNNPPPRVVRPNR